MLPSDFSKEQAEEFYFRNKRRADYLQRNQLRFFIRRAFSMVSPKDAYIHNWHIDAVSEALEATMRGEIKRLVLNIPPRFLKSICATISFPAFLLGHDPRTQIISASYAQKLSTKHSVDSRFLMQSSWYKKQFPNTIISDDQNEKMRIQTTARGHRIATSVGGSIIGEGGDFLIGDDLLNPEAAASETKRDRANTWFDNDLSTRLNDPKKGVIILVMQRLHELDVVGHAMGSEYYEIIKFPDFFEKKTTIQIGNFRREVEEGEWLMPVRHGPEQAAAKLKQLGTYGYSAQYRQQPSPAEGGLFVENWFLGYENPPVAERDAYLVQSWDTGFKDGEENDYSVCTTWLVVKEDYFLIDVFAEKLAYPGLKAALKRLAKKDAVLTGFAPAFVIVEDKASGQSLVQDIRSDNLKAGVGEQKIPISAIPVIGDKIVRASVCTAMIEAGQVHVKKTAAWWTDFIYELKMFPKGAHDDRVDSMTQFLNWVRNKKKPLKAAAVAVK